GRHRVEHLARLLRARRRVEVGERLAVEGLLEDGEVRAQLVRVERRNGADSHRPTVSSRPPATVGAAMSDYVYSMYRADKFYGHDRQVLANISLSFMHSAKI